MFSDAAIFWAFLFRLFSGYYCINSLLAANAGYIYTVYSKDLPLVFGDIALIDRALENIIDNAIQHCDQGDVVTLMLREDKQVKDKSF
ncbi:hypothetical protein [Pricia sp.]|uniref:hypothetical protein n=1 Tax=Pricia sp. TaxID=2268138 RepID=UPI0035936758